MAKNIYDVIIIGSGPAGMTAAIYCARKGLSTLIVGKTVGGQVALSAQIENYLGFGFSTGTELTTAFQEHVEKFINIDHLENVEVNKLTKVNKGFSVSIDDKQRFLSPAIIIASGRNPKQLNIPGEKEFKNKGVSYCEVCDGPLFAGKDVAVIGGGNSGLQAVISLANLCTKVYLLEFSKILKGDEILQDKIKKLKNVLIITEAQALEFAGDKFLTALKYQDLKNKVEKSLEVSGAFIEIGWIPSIDFDQITPKNKAGEIIVDKQCRTKIKGIFAAGDITDVGYWQIIIAAGEGAKAALSAYSYLSQQK